MEIKSLVNEKNHLEFKIIGERHTFPNLLKSRLLKDKDTDFVAYTLKHPLDQECKFILKTKSKEAKKVLQNACKAIEDDLDDFMSKVKKEIK